MKRLIAVCLCCLALFGCGQTGGGAPSSSAKGTDVSEVQQALSEALAQGDSAAGASFAPESAGGTSASSGDASSGSAERFIPSQDAPETLDPGAFIGQSSGTAEEYAPYIELYSDGTGIYVANVYEGLTVHLATWDYQDGRLTLSLNEDEDDSDSGPALVFRVESQEELTRLSGGEGVLCDTFLRGGLDGHAARN